MLLDKGVGIVELKEIFPEVWGESFSDKTKFIRLLYDYKYIDIEDWGRLFDSITIPAIRFSPEEEKVSTIRERLGGALWGKISDFFVMMWEEVWKFWPKQFHTVYDIVINAWFKTALGITDWYAEFFVSSIRERPGDPPFIIEASQEYKLNPSFMGWLWITLYRFGYAMGYAISVLGIVSKDAVRKLNKQYSPMLPDISSLVTYYYKEPGDRNTVYMKAAEQGFDKQEVDIYIDSMKALFSVDDLRNLFLRGEISNDELHQQLRRAGWDDKDIDELQKIFFVIPGPGDQIRFAVREAFDNEYIKRFDTLKDFPEGFAQQAQKVGVGRYWAEKYWIAHWELPPLAAAYEMLHRDVIKDGDLDELFKAQDIMPWWREKLKAISFNPLTRVDVRRMYKVGTLDKAGVHRAYLDVGYNEKNAALMTDFTIKWVTDNERDLTKADLLGAYERKLMTLADTRAGLVSMGYDDNEAGILISRIDYKVAKKKKSAVLKNLEKGYKKGIYNSTYIQQRMQDLNMIGTEITELVNLWEVETKDDTTSLSKADLDALFKKRVIEEAIYREEMSKLKYIQRDIDWMVKLHKGPG